LPSRIAGHSGTSAAKVNTAYSFTQRVGVTIPLPTAIPLEKIFSYF